MSSCSLEPGDRGCQPPSEQFALKSKLLFKLLKRFPEKILPSELPFNFAQGTSGLSGVEASGWLV
jgi:hypothetical protein